MLFLLISKRQAPRFSYSTTKKRAKTKHNCQNDYILENWKSHIRWENIGQKKNAYLKAAEENSLKVWTEHWGSYFS